MRKENFFLVLLLHLMVHNSRILPSPPTLSIVSKYIVMLFLITNVICNGLQFYFGSESEFFPSVVMVSERLGVARQYSPTT
ncbi:hypothetical protein CCP3SC1_50082 [Gammaproteobacteria bacterium]